MLSPIFNLLNEFSASAARSLAVMFDFVAHMSYCLRFTANIHLDESVEDGSHFPDDFVHARGIYCHHREH